MKHNQNKIAKPYIHLSSKNVKGHEGLLKLFSINNKGILVFSGRKHLYEGLSFRDVVTNVRLCYELGIKNLIITNAAGGINTKLKAADLMLITGFLNLMQPSERGLLDGITQKIVLVKSNLTVIVKKLLGNKIKTGIYAAVKGPTYETFSEINLLRTLGCSSVGMSTIPEMICAKSLGLNFAAISVISNIWSKIHKPSHKEVIETVSKANKKLNDLIVNLIDKL